ncbi:MAG: hypothetical protein ACOX5J_09905 [Candidatus Hydrogenedentales bacterium]|jgi:predicted RNA binding protein YcfA (HicA-like mRNA interferase family)
MPSGNEVADWLMSKGQVELGGSEGPPRPLEPEEELHEIAWDTLFPSSRPRAEQGQEVAVFSRLAEAPEEWRVLGNDPWQDELPAEFLGRVKDALGQDLPAEVETHEVEICAWYQPIHFYGHDWGIFIREQCIIDNALLIAQALPRALWDKVPPKVLGRALIRAGAIVFFLHEQYHHKTECLGIRLFVVEKQARYNTYVKNVYQATFRTDDNLEEALANADSYRRLGDEPYSLWLPKAVRDATKEVLKAYFRGSPPGYRMALHYLRKSDFEPAENQLQAQIHEGLLKPCQDHCDWDFAPRLLQSFFNVKDDIWGIVQSGTKPLLPGRSIMPVSTCSTAQVLTLLQQAGYQVVSGGKGSHIKAKKPGAPMMILPGGRDNLSAGVAKNLAHVLGIRGVGILRQVVTGGISFQEAISH